MGRRRGGRAGGLDHPRRVVRQAELLSHASSRLSPCPLVPDESGGPEKLALQSFDGYPEIGEQLILGGQLASVFPFLSLPCLTFETFKLIRLIHSLSEFVEGGDVLPYNPAVAPVSAVVVESSAPQFPSHDAPINSRRICANAGRNAS